jgi:hypothetical protein
MKKKIAIVWDKCISSVIHTTTKNYSNVNELLKDIYGVCVLKELASIKNINGIPKFTIGAVIENENKFIFSMLKNNFDFVYI